MRRASQDGILLWKSANPPSVDVGLAIPRPSGRHSVPPTRTSPIARLVTTFRSGDQRHCDSRLA
eukprot:332666-Chlamydomonas_euryale.AAC.1